jgi:hypothetical protein
MVDSSAAIWRSKNSSRPTQQGIIGRQYFQNRDCLQPEKEIGQRNFPMSAVSAPGQLNCCSAAWPNSGDEKPRSIERRRRILNSNRT